MHLFEIKIILSVLIGLLWFVIPLFKRFVCTQKVTAHIDKTTIKSGEMDSEWNVRSDHIWNGIFFVQRQEL